MGCIIYVVRISGVGLLVDLWSWWVVEVVVMDEEQVWCVVFFMDRSLCICLEEVFGYCIVEVVLGYRFFGGLEFLCAIFYVNRVEVVRVFYFSRVL